MTDAQRVARVGLAVAATVFVVGFGVAARQGEASGTRSPAASTLAYLALWAWFGLPVALAGGAAASAGVALQRRALGDRDVRRVLGGLLLVPAAALALLLLKLLLRTLVAQLASPPG